MAALYIAIACPSGLYTAMIENGKKNVFMRFLAEMCTAIDDQIHSNCYQELVKLFSKIAWRGREYRYC